MAMRAGMLVVVCLVVAGEASAQVYRWVDAQGRVHYSDDPPAGVAVDRVELPARPPVAVSASGDLGTPDVTATSPDATPGSVSPPLPGARGSDPARAVASDRERSCLRARMDLAVLEFDRPVYRDSDGRLGVFWAAGTRPNYYEGERTYLSEDERRELGAGARAVMERDCAEPQDRAAQAAAEAAWLHEEDCRAMQAELASLRRPQMRTPESDLERKQREADAFCAAPPPR